VKIKDLKELGADELKVKLADMKQSYMKLRFQHATAQLDSPAKIRDARRDIAKVKTLLNQRKAS